MVVVPGVLGGHTGVVVVPGNGFGQREKTFHFRMTILPTEQDWQNLKFLTATDLEAEEALRNLRGSAEGRTVRSRIN